MPANKKVRHLSTADFGLYGLAALSLMDGFSRFEVEF